MRAVVIHSPHDLRIEDVPEQTLGARQVRVRIVSGGICGSDLHYYQHGGFGTVRLREPMVLGHEVAGVVARVGTEVTSVRVGDHVAINPSLPCGLCTSCMSGSSNQCVDMRFFGSAMRYPHVQGAFRDEVVVEASQAVPVDPGLDFSVAAFAEPLAVTLHAVSQAGSVLGKRVLVTGCGPIGSLLIGSLRRAGAAEIVAVDLAQAPLECALNMGADKAVNPAEDAYRVIKDAGASFDVHFETSGSGKALQDSLGMLKPGAIIIAVGLGGDITLPINTLVGRELTMRGTFRFHSEFAFAAEFLSKGLVDVRPVLSKTFSARDALTAFEVASDRNRTVKVQLQFQD